MCFTYLIIVQVLGWQRVDNVEAGNWSGAYMYMQGIATSKMGRDTGLKWVGYDGEDRATSDLPV